jgi:predicted phosphodiesterase
MRIAVLSDIHSNLVALEAVLTSIGPADAIWHLGDVVGYGPDPNGVVERLQKAGARGVRGNHDAAAVGGVEIEWFNADARAAMEWTRRRITPDTERWLTDLPERRVDTDFTLVHGSPRDPTWEYITSIPVARANIAALSTRYGLHGHTHIPICFREDDGRVEAVSPGDGSSLALDHRPVLLNPGSVGQPRDGMTTASYMVLDTDANRCSWSRVAYDIAAVQEAMTRERLPERLIARLSYGI